MSVTPPASLERVIARHGDALYRVALLLTPNEAAAARALRAVFQRPAALAGEDLADLLPPLLATLAPRATRATRATRAPRTGPPDLARALAALPFAQRRALVLQLLLGYDLPDVARLSGVSVDEACGERAAALAALAMATGASLPAEQPTEQCASVRALIAQTPATPAAESQVRGHEALCSACRSFDHAWQALTQRAEAALRARTRDLAMPSALATSLLTRGTVSYRLEALVAHVGTRRLALTLLPAGVLLLIAALVLPGFWHSPVAATLSSASPSADPQALIAQALAQRDRPPAGDGVLWHGRWETRWYFPSGTVAPITLDAWLDPTSSARHRLQVVHAQGGAPFELEIGDGTRNLYYALSPSYYDSLYGVPPNSTEPQLRHHALDADAQREALRERLGAGVWALAESYLRQAQAAPDLRTLGRQRDGDHVVQLLRYRGSSPLGPPSDAPRVTGDARVSILLALDTTDGRLRSVTELTGQDGGAQSSEVVLRLASEEWLATEKEASAALDPARAWNGRGVFPANADEGAADSTLLLADAERTSTLERLLARSGPQLVVPAAPPPGVERALVLWNEGGRRSDNQPQPTEIIYLGPGKQLSLSWRARGPGGTPDEQLTAGEWAVSLQVRRAQFYRLWGVSTVPSTGRPDPSAAPPAFAITAHGFTRAELLALVASLGPLDLSRWRAQRELFKQLGVEPQARAALEAAIDAAQPPAPGALIYRRERSFSRANPQPETLHDPYHLARYSRLPPAYHSETWLEGTQEAGRIGRYSEMYDARESLVQSWLNQPGWHSWGFNASARQLNIYPAGFDNDALAWIDSGTRAAIDLLANPGLGVDVPEGTRYVVRRQPIERSDYEQLSIAAMDDERLPFIADLNVSLVVTELSFTANGGVSATRTSVVGYSDGKRVERVAQLWNLEEQRAVGQSEVPLPLRNGGTPVVAARYINEWTGSHVTLGEIHTVPLSDAIALSRSPFFVLSSPEALVTVEAAFRPGGARSFTNDALSDAVRDGVAVRLTYGAEHDRSQQLVLVQGPAEALSDYIRTHDQSPFWQRSEQLQFMVAGRPVRGWVLSQTKQTGLSWACAELDGTLLIAQNPPNDLALTWLNALQRVQ